MQNRDVRIVPLFVGHIHMETCPQCDYVLESLPAAHSCPECGFEYDDGMRWFKLKLMPDRGFQESLIVLACILIPFFVLVAIFPKLANVLYFGLVPSLFLVELVRWLRSGKGPGLLALTAKGVDVYDKWRMRRHVPWSAIGSAECSKWTGFVVLRDDDRRKLMSISSVALGGHFQAQTCADEMSRRLEEFSA